MRYKEIDAKTVTVTEDRKQEREEEREEGEERLGMIKGRGEDKGRRDNKS